MMKKLRITINDVVYDVKVEELPGEEGAQAPASIERVSPPRAAAPVPQAPVIPKAPSVSGGSGDISAPMPGVVKGIKVQVGQTVQTGDTILILEAMKMENEISTKKAGVVKEVKVTEGQIVGMGEILVVIE